MVPSCFWKACLGALVCLFLLAGLTQGSAQQFANHYSVDCTNPSVQPPQFPTISSAVAAATDGTSVYVPPGQTCTENVNIGYLKTIAIVTDWKKTFNLNGNLTIQSSHTVEIQGMVVTNPNGNGIAVKQSSDVTLTFVESVNNSGTGLALTSSQVIINGAGAFSNNGNIGITAGTNSTLWIFAWEAGGVVDISNNTGTGLNADRSVVGSYGNTTISNTKAVPASPPSVVPSGFGINEFGGAKAGFFAGLGPVIISSNAGGGVSLAETSEMSLGGGVSWASNPVIVQGNGPVGIALAYGGSLTLFGTQVTGHTTAGITLYGNSQASLLGPTDQISNNGTGTGTGRAGIVVEQGSQALVSEASIQNNGGPGILGLLHATLDVEGSTFSSNADGAIVCDQSTALATDLAHSALGSANACTVAPPGNHSHAVGNMSLALPDWQGVKARSIRLSQMIAQHHLAAIPSAK
jgi:hypothetical protein